MPDPNPANAADAAGAPAPGVPAVTAVPASPAAEARAGRELTALAATDPERALALAAGAPNPRQRARLRDAALRGWASTAPADAMAWTLEHVHPPERRDSIQALAEGAVARPEEAMATFQRLVAADPANASIHGSALATALAHDGQFDAACRFAAAGPAAVRNGWLSTIYQTWAAYDPSGALRSLDALPDHDQRAQARASLFVGWSTSDPAALVAYARDLPPGADRLDAFTHGLSEWVFRDPVAATEWMDAFDPSPDLDAGAAAVATSPVLVAHRPEVATSWAESITDPELRASTLLDLIRIWAESDTASARRYVTTAAALTPETRAAALSTLDGPAE